jgi:hypothetical protein
LLRTGLSLSGLALTPYGLILPLCGLRLPKVSTALSATRGRLTGFAYPGRGVKAVNLANLYQLGWKWTCEDFF